MKSTLRDVPGWLCILGCVLTGLLLPGTADAQGRATLRGRAVDQGGNPVFPATLALLRLDDGAERPAVTENDGSFVFGGLRPGRYQVRLEESAYVPFLSEVLVLEAGQDRTMNISLRPLAPPVPPPFPAPPPERTPDYVPAPDRWRLRYPATRRYPANVDGADPFVEGRPLDPYNRNTIKGDRPVIGDEVFFVLTAISETPFEYRNVPTPAGVSTERPQSEGFFGEGEQFTLLPSAIVSLELFKGDTAFKPRDWAVRVTPVFNLNYNGVRERTALHATPEDGTTRRRHDFALQEAFGEVKLADVSSNFDFISVRGGIQPFTSDFRGFLFRDTNLGVRGFGTWGSNRNQWNVAYFDQLEKETNSELNILERRDQVVIIANYYRQDFLTLGYTFTGSFHANLDRAEEFFFDENGFLVRPAPIGFVDTHEVKAYYAGFGGDGHWGRLNISHQFYQAWGEDELNGIAGRPVDINARFAVVEASVDRDWWRLKGTFLYASGDDDPLDGTGRGFDAIFDAPNIGGGPFSFWNRETIRLSQTQVGLVGRDSVLPSLRSSKTEGQANFVNPGLFLYNVGFEADLTPKLRSSVNVNLLRFDKTQVLETVLFHSSIDNAIGIDYGVGFEYRPWLNDNIVVQAGVSFLTPLDGFKNILTDETLYTPFVVLTVKY